MRTRLMPATCWALHTHHRQTMMCALGSRESCCAVSLFPLDLQLYNGIVPEALSIDGTIMRRGDRVLLVAQVDAVENGIYAAGMGRSADMRQGCRAAGSTIYIRGVTTELCHSYQCTADPSVDVVGSNALPWRKVSAVGPWLCPSVSRSRDMCALQWNKIPSDTKRLFRRFVLVAIVRLTGEL